MANIKDMKHLILSFLFFAVFNFLSAQTETKELEELKLFSSGYENNEDDGTIKIVSDKAINDLLEKHIDLNGKINGFQGWRIQIYFGSDSGSREKAQEMRAKFIRRFPNYRSYVDYEIPYFKVRVGNFRTKQEALKLKKQLEKYFVNSWLVEDIVEFPPLKTK